MAAFTPELTLTMARKIIARQSEQIDNVCDLLRKQRGDGYDVVPVEEVWAVLGYEEDGDDMEAEQAVRY